MSMLETTSPIVESDPWFASRRAEPRLRTEPASAWDDDDDDDIYEDDDVDLDEDDDDFDDEDEDLFDDGEDEDFDDEDEDFEEDYEEEEGAGFRTQDANVTRRRTRQAGEDAGRLAVALRTASGRHSLWYARAAFNAAGVSRAGSAGCRATSAERPECVPDPHRRTHG